MFFFGNCTDCFSFVFVFLLDSEAVPNMTWTRSITLWKIHCCTVNSVCYGDRFSTLVCWPYYLEQTDGDALVDKRPPPLNPLHGSRCRSSPTIRWCCSLVERKTCCATGIRVDYSAREASLKLLSNSGHSAHPSVLPACLSSPFCATYMMQVASSALVPVSNVHVSSPRCLNAKIIWLFE